MINKVSFTVKDDYNEITLRRDEGSSQVQMQLHYYNGCKFATFNFEDFKKAVEILETAGGTE